MTKRKINNPFVEQWLIELDAVIRHEILNYLVEEKLAKGDDFFFDPSPFMVIDEVILDAIFVYWDKLNEAKDDAELAELLSSVGSIEGIDAAKRFLEENDHLVQVIEKTNLEELTSSARNILTEKYPVAIRSVEYLMIKTGGNSLPQCLKWRKLNNLYGIENLWISNDLERVLIFHTELIQNTLEKKKTNLSKPELITSNKKSEFIEIIIEEKNGEIRFISDYKLDKIKKLDQTYQKKVLAYCEELVKHQLEKYISGNNQDKVKNTPIPPPEKMLATRYDGYLAYIIGMYCIRNKSKYKTIEGLEYEQEFDSFKSFVKNQLFDKFDFLREEFKNWCYSNGTGDCSDDIDNYITNVLTKRIKANIDKTQKEIEKYKEYFSDGDITN